MQYKAHIHNIIACILLVLGCCDAGRVAAQAPPWTPDAWGPSDTSIKYNCREFQWPLTQSPCPEVQIKEKHDHSPLRQYQAVGWDTVIDCHTRDTGITLSCMPYVPAQFFNGQYTVDTIPYNPPDPTFSYGLDGTAMKMPVATDDDFAENPTQIPFDFYFFGIKKSAFVLGANGLITFDTTAAGRYCPWKIASGATMPWPNSKATVPNGLGCTKANMRDAIYGIYEDTHPIAAYLHGDQGIYYGIQGEEPCRKIIASWNGIPTFPGSRNQNNRCTYQIVCYEGSNIIEVHIKRRGINPDWQNGRGVLGIQNATGAGQENGGIGTSTYYVRSGAPAAYYPTGGNLLTTELDSIAFRFTPQGFTPNKPHQWLRLFDNDSTVELQDVVHNPEAIYDTNGYYYPMGHNPSCPNLSLAKVNPTTVSRYIFHLRFLDAANHWYDLYDTIVIGQDTVNDLTLRPQGGRPGDEQMDICAGQEGRLVLEFPDIQDTAAVQLTLTRLNGGANTPLPTSMVTFGQMYTDPETSLKRIPLMLHSDSMASDLSAQEVDSILVHVHTDFVSECWNTDDLLVRIFPTYDVVVDTGICQGESFRWDLDGQSYTQATNSPTVTLHSEAAQCDSVVHLHLHVSANTEYVDSRAACKPIEWHGRWYSESGTARFDTINQWGCDSTVILDFTLTPMTPIIDANLDHFDFNNLDVVLTDVSTGGNGRTWLFPTGDPQYTPVAYYTAPYHIDSAVIRMIETSPYGCIDTATITIPFHRDVIWVPNSFTPDLPDGGNDRFGSVSNHLLKQQMLIYNRFGALVFHCEGIDCQWDGTDADGQPMPQGTYIYVIRYTTEYAPHMTQSVQGSVTLIR